MQCRQGTCMARCMAPVSWLKDKTKFKLGGGGKKKSNRHVKRKSINQPSQRKQSKGFKEGTGGSVVKVLAEDSGLAPSACTGQLLTSCNTRSWAPLLLVSERTCPQVHAAAPTSASRNLNMR